MMLENIIGYLATIVGTLLMLPQVIQSFRTKSVKDISMFTVLAYVANCILWALYGITISAKPVIIANTIALVIALAQLYLKLKYK